ncbi:hypothetical protein EW146_g755 [Bondarzewia mesenterica]|uniref:Glucosamine 6-phosphate N-acetyltransferase n=1 Tax=Bondarzewia mesenterica TaxID=1095465 RepID=A0A4S4MC61_9AGAM|nr:hypothetical protein EW146_g755 [Bondarzewia mesenterica]
MSSSTPDSQLDLLFPAHLIPQKVRDELPADLHIRPLASTDYHRGHLAVLQVLTAVTDPGEAAYVAQFNTLRAIPHTYYTLVIVSKQTDRVVGVGSVFLERKFLRGLGIVGHIEDIAVDASQQGKKLGLRIIHALTGISESNGSYKTILNCSDKNIPFYEKCGFMKKENEMPYDPYLPRGGSSTNPNAGQTGNPKTAAIQAQIDDTVNIMRDNITKVTERQERLDSLQDKTDNLAVSAQGFRRNANRVRKMRIIIGVAIAIIIVIIVVSIVKATKH